MCLAATHATSNMEVSPSGKSNGDYLHVTCVHTYIHNNIFLLLRHKDGEENLKNPAAVEGEWMAGKKNMKV